MAVAAALAASPIVTAVVATEAGTAWEAEAVGQHVERPTAETKAQL